MMNGERQNSGVREQNSEARSQEPEYKAETTSTDFSSFLSSEF
jgi:hypothetical protein